MSSPKYVVYLSHFHRESPQEFPTFHSIECWEADKLEDVCVFLKQRKIPFERVNSRALCESFPEDFLFESFRLYHQPFFPLWALVLNGRSIDFLRANERMNQMPDNLTYALVLQGNSLHYPVIFRNHQGYACTSEQYKKAIKKKRRTKGWKKKRTYRRVRHRANDKKDKVWLKSEMTDCFSAVQEESEIYLPGEVENQIKRQARKRLHSTISDWDLYEKVRSEKNGCWKIQRKKRQYE